MVIFQATKLGCNTEYVCDCIYIYKVLHIRCIHLYGIYIYRYIYHNIPACSVELHPPHDIQHQAASVEPGCVGRVR